jgi:hypothetical protein
MDGIGVETAGKWLGGLAELRVNATQPGRVQKNAGPVGLLVDPPRAAQRHEQRRVRGHTVSRGPVLSFNSLLFLFCDPNNVLATAATAVVAGPVLKHREQQAGTGHGELSARKRL